MKRTLKRELKVLEIVEGEAIGGCYVPGLSAVLTGGVRRRERVSMGWACGRNLLFVESLCRGPDRGTKGALTFDLRPQDAGIRLPMGPS
jgi:hypothetical protein